MIGYLLSGLVIIYTSGCEGGHWNYGSKGPSTWAKEVNKQCGWRRQSPIAIRTDDVKMFRLPSISTNYMSAPSNGKYTIVNNGHALQINFPSNTKYRLQKGVHTFKPLQVHMHFGNANTGKGGSEHTLDGANTFAELHIVQKNVKPVPGSKNVLLVVGMFADLPDNNSGRSFYQKLWNRRMLSGTSFAMNLFTSYAKLLTKPGSRISIAPFRLGWFLPLLSRGVNNVDMVNYYGSLTTPPCSQVVDWVLITGRKLYVSKRKALRLLLVKNSEGEKMAGNNRPIQKTNGRVVVGMSQL